LRAGDEIRETRDERRETRCQRMVRELVKISEKTENRTNGMMDFLKDDIICEELENIRN
jgi:hypothetical protein